MSGEEGERQARIQRFLCADMVPASGLGVAVLHRGQGMVLAGSEGQWEGKVKGLAGATCRGLEVMDAEQ